MKSEYDIIIEKSQGIPISGLVENWSFMVNEIAPYIWKAQGVDTHNNTVVGYGGSAHDALKDCVKRANKIVLRDKRGQRMQNAFSRIRDKIGAILGAGK